MSEQSACTLRSLKQYVDEVSALFRDEELVSSLPDTVTAEGRHEMAITVMNGDVAVYADRRNVEGDSEKLTDALKVLIGATLVASNDEADEMRMIFIGLTFQGRMAFNSQVPRAAAKASV